jgi:HEAT repeat protein
MGEDAPLDLITKALGDPSSWVRRAAVETFGSLGEHAPLEPLLWALADPNKYVRQAAVQMLSGLGERAPLIPLTQALADHEELVREAAVKAVGALGQRIPLSCLLKALQDWSSGVRQAALLVVHDRAPHEITRAASAAARILLVSVADPADIPEFGALWQMGIVDSLRSSGVFTPSLGTYDFPIAIDSTHRTVLVRSQSRPLYSLT